MIDIIIPVYRGLRQTRRCIESVLECRQSTPVEAIVVDDCSPEPEISRYAQELAHDGRITLLRNETNRGFVESVNRGMLLHADRDVILLNSDTEVANDWVDRLRATAYSAPRVATVTPFSNNATICSYPFEGMAGGVPGGLGLAALDRLFAGANAGQSIDLPTGVGFCILIRRDCLRELGPFDAQRFGRGYGEENDFCMRAGKAGWRNLLAGDVFVFHEGAVSFLEERLERAEAANDALLEVHPEYTQRVHEFILADPPRALRAAVDRARVAQGPEEAACVLSERAQEYANLLARFRELERFAAQRDAHIGELHEALDRTKALVAERSQALEKDVAERDEQISQLRAGLANAESLAFSRLAELEEIHSFRLWRFYKALMRWRSRAIPGGPRRQED